MIFVPERTTLMYTNECLNSAPLQLQCMVHVRCIYQRQWVKTSENEEKHIQRQTDNPNEN